MLIDEDDISMTNTYIFFKSDILMFRLLVGNCNKERKEIECNL